MHYILLAFALKFGEKNIDYMKLTDMKNAIVPESNVYSEIIGPKLNIQEEISDLPDSNSIIFNQEFPDSEESVDIDAFANPYIENNNFAELLPEEEINNIIEGMEVEGPTFLESIKRRLIRLTEWAKKPKKKETVLGEEVEGPTFLESIKNKVLGIVSKTEGVIENINVKKEENATKKDSADEKKDIEIPNNKNAEQQITIKDKEKKDTEKVLDIAKNDNQIPDALKKETTIKIVGTLFDSELNQTLKGGKSIDYTDFLNKSSKDALLQELEYKEDNEYSKFLDEKEKDKKVEVEKDIFENEERFANIKPVKKVIIDYRTKKIPDELLLPRSFQNRHIPKIIQQNEKEDVFKKVVEYGMMPEFRAFVNEIEDINQPLQNQYNLMTFVVQNKQYDMMRYLLYNEIDVNRRDKRLNNPVIVAVQNNDIEALKILNEANANLDVLDILKRTPLIYAIEKGYEDIGIYLIENGADINITNNLGEGILSMSERLKRFRIRNKILEKIKEGKK